MNHADCVHQTWNVFYHLHLKNQTSRVFRQTKTAFKKEYIFLDYVLRGSKVTQAIIIIQYHFDQSGAEIAQPPPFCISHHFVFPAILAQPFNKCPWERDRLRALFNATRTGEHFTKGPKNLSRVYKYLTLSFASLAASVMRLSC